MSYSGNIVLPRGYLSWSQFDLWRKSKKSYKKRYFDGEPSFSTEATRFGSRIAKMIEDGETDELPSELVVLDEPEKKIEVECEGVPLLAYIDSFGFDDKGVTFREYKTGRAKWAQSRVQGHDQMVYYALAIYLKYGKLPYECWLDWMPTRKKEKPDWLEGMNEDEQDIFNQPAGTELTGELHCFKREINSNEIERLQRDIVKVAQEITKDYKEYLLQGI